MNHSIWVKLKNVKIKDILSIFKLIIALPYALFVRIRYGKFWVICESENEARDNGYWLFKYICENTDKYVVYAINNKSSDRDKVKSLGNVISYGTIKHWAYYIASALTISTQKSGNPNAAICYVLEVYGISRKKRIFLQHGITYNNAEWLYYDNTKFKMFICGAKPEYEYVSNIFGYPEENIQYLGFCRFDNLLNTKRTVDKKRILVMPTWREWLVNKTQMTKESGYNGVFETTPYFNAWLNLLNNKQLNEMLKNNNIELIFYPHRNMQPFLDKFTVESENVILASWKEYDIQDLFINTDMMITDYSSVLFDYAYLKKPIVFYQFDYDDFRKGQYKEGYFDFKNQQLGQAFYEETDIVEAVGKIIMNDFKITDEQDKYISNFFELYDNKNCERTYEAILKVEKGK